MKKLNVLTRMLLLVALLVGSTSSVWADEVPYKTLTFTSSNSTKTNDYLHSWTEAVGDDSWTIANFNNNNWGWTDGGSPALYIVKCGRKRTSASSYNPTIATITTDAAMSEPITKVVVTLTAINSTDYNSIKMYVASNSDFTENLQTINVTVPTSAGDLTFNVETPVANRYYKIAFDTKGSLSSGNGHTGLKKVIYYTESGKSSAGLSFTPSSINVAIGGEENVAFSKTTDATPSFVVGDETVATYNAATGKVTGLKEGTTTITATTSETSTYAAGMAVCTVTVYDPSWLDYTMKGYENAEEVTSETYAYGTVALAANGGTSPKWYDSGTAVRIYNKNTITITAPVGYVLTSVEFSITSGSMAASNFNKTVTGEDGVFYLTTPANEVIYTTSANFRIDKVKLNIAEPATITLNAACNDGEGNIYGTYSNAKAFVVPADLTVSAVGIDNEGKLKVTDYSTGEVVKANTGVMVSSTTAGDHTILLSDETGTEKDGNLLKASGNAGIEDAEAMETAAPGCKYYRLTMHNTTDLGFYYGAENGAAFALAANKAYLAVPESLAKEGFSFITGEEETDGIKAVSTKVENGVRYNLAGQKVGADYKGIVIVNGKKMLNK